MISRAEATPVKYMKGLFQGESGGKKLKTAECAAGVINRRMKDTPKLIVSPPSLAKTQDA